MLFLPGSDWENRRLFVEFCVRWGGSAIETRTSTQSAFFVQVDYVRASLGRDPVIGCDQLSSYESNLSLHACFAKDCHHRTPVRESRLKQIQADESCEQKPVRTHPISQCERQQDESACNHSKIAFDVHGIASCLVCSVYKIFDERLHGLVLATLAQVIENGNGHA